MSEKELCDIHTYAEMSRWGNRCLKPALLRDHMTCSTTCDWRGMEAGHAYQVRYTYHEKVKESWVRLAGTAYWSLFLTRGVFSSVLSYDNKSLGESEVACCQFRFQSKLNVIGIIGISLLSGHYDRDMISY